MVCVAVSGFARVCILVSNARERSRALSGCSIRVVGVVFGQRGAVGRGRALVVLVGRAGLRCG